MYSRPEELLEKYPITVKSFSKGRECYLCDTNLGMLALREYRGSDERARFLEEMLKYLKCEGLLVEEMVRSKEGELLVSDEEERKFFLCEYYHGAECDTKSRGDMLIAVKELARFHNAAGTFTGEIPELIKRKKDSLQEVCERHNREIKQVRNYIRNKKKKNSFERLFVSQCEVFLEKAQRVTEAFKSVEGETDRYGFCHGDYNQHSIVFSKKGATIVGLERFSYDLQIRDLANFVRKMMEKNDWDVALGKELIEAYQEVRGLKELEKQYLYFFLAYPEKFWKLANHYNSAHKTWLSERNVEKLEKVILQEKKRETFLTLLFSEGIGYT